MTAERSPSTVQRSPRGSRSVAAGREAQLAALAGDRALAGVRAPHHEVDAVDRAARVSTSRGDERVAAPRARARRSSPRAATGTARSRRRRRGRPTPASTPSSANGAARSTAASTGGVRVVGDDDHRVLVEERVDAAAGVAHRARSGGRRAAIDVDLRVRAVLVRVRVVVGQRQQQEVEEVVLDQVRADAARRAGRARPGMPELRAAAASRGWRRCRRRRARAGPSPASQQRSTPARVSAVARETWCSWRPRYIRYVVPAVRTSGVVERLEDRRHVGAAGARRSCCRRCR